MRNLKFQFVLILMLGASITLVLNGCTESARKSMKAKQTAFGDVNHLYVIADKEIWEGPIGDSLRYYYTGPYLVLPQPEPIFELGHYTFRQFTEEKIRMQLRSLVFLADLSNEDSPATKFVKQDIELGGASETKSKVGKDKWAKDQTLVYLYGNSEQDLMNTVLDTWGAVRKKFNQADAPVVKKTAFVSGKDIKIMNTIRESLNIEMDVPTDYYLAHDDKEALWLRKETQDISSNILISKAKYVDKSQLTKEGIKQALDELGAKHISSRQENSFMKINDIDLPMFVNQASFQQHYAVKVRGIWELENDYMGGPFLAYAILNEKAQDIIYVNGFVYAPCKPKLRLIQYLDSIFGTIKITNS